MIIDIVKSFHDGMKARVRIGGEMLDEIEVTNGLRQGYTLAPVLFNPYACLVVEQWACRVADTEEVGTYLRIKFDGKLFRRSPRSVDVVRLHECQFSDDAALLVITRAGAEKTMWEYIDVAAAFGLQVSIDKTKFMVVG